MNDMENTFVSVALILGWMERNEFGFDKFRIPDLATALEIAEPLHVDRFRRIKKATSEEIERFVEQLADYWESITVIRGDKVSQLQEAAKKGWEALHEVSTEILAKQKAEAPLPSGCDQIGWMYQDLEKVRVQAKAATVIAPTPDARKANIDARVREMKSAGMKVGEAYKLLAREQGVKPDTIKKIHLRK